jgi:hypothetical protein
MKTVIALLLANASAARVADGPAYFNEATWNERMPSAGGFVMLTACQRSGIEGISCAIPNRQLFATGMNGDEDLGEDIQMKGEPFHFRQAMAQWNPLEVATPFADLPPCTGNNGPVFVNCKRQNCSGTNGPMDGPASSGCEQEQVTSIPHYNEDPKAGRPYKTTGDITKTDVVPAPASYPGQQSLYIQLEDDPAPKKPSEEVAKVAGTPKGAAEDAQKAEVKAAVPQSVAPEKVEVLETPIARAHTTFHAQQ